MNEPSVPLSPEALRTYERLALWTEIWGPGGLELAASLAHAMQLPPGAKVLDAGGGSGEISCFLALQYGWQVTMLDADQAAVQQARRKVRARGLTPHIEVLQGDLSAPDFPAGAFAGIFCQGALEMLGERRAATVHALKRLLVPGGVLGIAEPMLRAALSQQDRRRLHGNDFAAAFWTLERYRALCQEAGFSVEVRELHPQSLRLWNEFIAPWFDSSGELKRPEVREVAEAWRRDGGQYIALGILMARKQVEAV